MLSISHHQPLFYGVFAIALVASAALMVSALSAKTFKNRVKLMLYSLGLIELIVCPVGNVLYALAEKELCSAQRTSHAILCGFGLTPMIQVDCLAILLPCLLIIVGYGLLQNHQT